MTRRRPHHHHHLEESWWVRSAFGGAVLLLAWRQRHRSPPAGPKRKIKFGSNKPSLLYKSIVRETKYIYILMHAFVSSFCQCSWERYTFGGKKKIPSKINVTVDRRTGLLEVPDTTYCVIIVLLQVIYPVRTSTVSGIRYTLTTVHYDEERVGRQTNSESKRLNKL